VILQPIVYSTDTAAAADWYEKVLGTPPGHRSDMWTTFPFGGAYLAIHQLEAPRERGRVEISLVATERLEDVLARLAAAGIEPAEGIVSQPFGRSFLLRDPDGSPVQVNEHVSST
jgi:predicted enzyme related to lactoylglutathione lyase